MTQQQPPTYQQVVGIVESFGVEANATIEQYLRKSQSSGWQTLILNTCTTLTNIRRIHEITTLQQLQLINCQGITDISVLRDFRNLIALDISYCNNIRVFNVLKGCMKLKLVNVSCLGVQDASFFGGITSLMTVKLRYCGHLGDTSALRGMSQLRALDVTECYNTSVDTDFLKTLPSLDAIHMSENCVDDAILCEVRGRGVNVKEVELPLKGMGPKQLGEKIA
ncbi:uncharacterized protein TEOVI_000593500 [Trypanosoma equiperdum]|uniref:Leucine-rich repeat protein (LRRP) n=1 Tax=Trypanosoma equiperdum TaxID=5694 RepID=A0A1G4IKJ4_TRYEQ|nr:hypothetical protein, conserved [Trypanosoma equiperdum]